MSSTATALPITADDHLGVSRPTVIGCCQPFRWVEDADQVLASLKRQPNSGSDRQQPHRHGTATPG